MQEMETLARQMGSARLPHTEARRARARGGSLPSGRPHETITDPNAYGRRFADTKERSSGSQTLPISRSSRW